MKRVCQFGRIIMLMAISTFCLQAKGDESCGLYSNSYDSDSIKSPWHLIDPISEKMKPGYPFAERQKEKRSLIPYIIGIPMTGGLVYFLTKSDDDSSNCDFTINQMLTHATCDQSNGSIMIGTEPPGNYSYQWSHGASGPKIENLAAGQYTVTVSTLGDDCSRTLTITIINSIESIPFSLDFSETDCNMPTGSAIVTPIEPGEYTYLWSTGDTSPSINNLPAGDYSVTISRSPSCQASASFTISEKEADFTLNVMSQASLCNMNNGAASVSITPPSEYTYLWSEGSTDDAIEFLAPDQYSVTVTDLNGCSKSATVEVEQLLDDIQISIATTPADCGQENGMAEATINPFTINNIIWSNGSSETILTDVSAGNYAVTVTNENGCSAAASFIIEELGPDYDISFTTTSATCFQANGSISADVSQPGQFEYQWSSGDVGPAVSNLTAGEYTVTITDQNGCTDSASAIIEAVTSIQIIDSIYSTPGNCIDGGDIFIDLSASEPGPVILNLAGPDGTTQLSLPTGQNQLSDYTDIPTGDYSIHVYYEGIGNIWNICTDSTDISVIDTTLRIQLVNDTFTTSSNTPLNENVLTNDQGFHLSMIAIDSVEGGTVNFVSNGTFNFIPDPGYTGMAGFQYIAQDTCQVIDTALASIIINDVMCDFNALFDMIPASCGATDGQLTAMVSEPGNYAYLWDNGVNGPVLTGIGSGNYVVSITDTDLNCTLEFETSIDELPPDYITEVEIMQASCTFDANIIFEVIPSPTGSYDMEVFYPDGDEEFTISETVIFLGDYVPIVEGNYSVMITPTDIGYPCQDGFMATMNATEGIIIEVVDISPASSPSASDGEVTIEITNPGVEPYTVLIDGDVWSVVTGTLFTISGLPAGEYTIQIIDDEGCTSNEILVVIPFQTNVSLSTGLSTIMDQLWPPLYEGQQEQSVSHQRIYAQQTVLNYSLFGIPHESSIDLAISSRQRIMQLRHLVTLGQAQIGSMNVSALAGMQTTISEQSQFSLFSVIDLKTTFSDNYHVGLRIGINKNNLSISPFAQFSVRKDFRLDMLNKVPDKNSSIILFN